VGKRRVFKANREPQYFVITKWQPEEIERISLKFRDLHVTYAIMMDYTDRFVKAVEQDHQRHEGRLDFNAPITRRSRQYMDLIRLMFSSHLSTYATILYYLNDAITENGRKWLSEVRERDPTFASFDRLRNRDVHHEPMHTLIGMRFRIVSSTPPYSSLDTKEVHIHQDLIHEGPGFYPPPVLETDQFKRHPGLAQFITFESILQLSHTAIHKVADLLTEATALGYFQSNHAAFRCGPCENAGKPSHAVNDSADRNA
jgi:hypothetical protein